jgi:hypothetical protein
MCPDSLGLLDRDSEVKLLQDGRLLIDDGETANIFDRGFCLEYFSDWSAKSLTLSAFLCKSVVPDQTFPSVLARKTRDEKFSGESQQHVKQA